MKLENAYRIAETIRNTNGRVPTKQGAVLSKDFVLVWYSDQRDWQRFLEERDLEYFLLDDDEDYTVYIMDEQSLGYLFYTRFEDTTLEYQQLINN